MPVSQVPVGSTNTSPWAHHHHCATEAAELEALLRHYDNIVALGMSLSRALVMWFAPLPLHRASLFHPDATTTLLLDRERESQRTRTKEVLTDPGSARYLEIGSLRLSRELNETRTEGLTQTALLLGYAPKGFSDLPLTEGYLWYRHLLMSRRLDVVAVALMDPAFQSIVAPVFGATLPSRTPPTPLGSMRYPGDNACDHKFTLVFMLDRFTSPRGCATYLFQRWVQWFPEASVVFEDTSFLNRNLVVGASSSDNCEILRCLLGGSFPKAEFDLSLNVEKCSGATLRVVQEVIPEFNFLAKAEGEELPLLLRSALNRQRLDILRFLLRFTPLGGAASEGSYSARVPRTSEVDTQEVKSYITPQGHTLLTHVLSGPLTPSTAVVELLIEFGAGTNTPCSSGLYPLHLCAKFGFWKLAGVLVSKGRGCNINQQAGEPAPDFDSFTEGLSHLGWTPLHFAVAECCYLGGERGSTTLGEDLDNATRTVEVLLGMGASTTVKDSEGRTSLDVAKTLRGTTILKLLKKWKT